MKSNLKKLLQEKNISQRQLSRDTKVNLKFVNQLANNNVKGLRIDALESMSKYLDNCKLSDLICFDHE